MLMRIIILGVAQKELGRLEEAEISYKKAIELNPNNGEYYYNLGQNYRSVTKREGLSKSVLELLIKIKTLNQFTAL